MTTSTRGAELARALLASFTGMVDEVVGVLEAAGHPGVTATHEFALRAISAGARNATELGRSLGVSKQAAAKTIEALEQLGYLDRRPDPDDARRKRLTVTPRGTQMTAIGARAFERIRARWAEQLEPGRLEQLENDLEQVSAPARHHAGAD